jgi:23S rRNA (cytidine1920-2'-O)/16S rRNA (cytidine1409-2'-O)-methyltransferase
MRLDNYLVQNGYFESRNRAQEALKAGLVSVNSKVITKASFKVSDDALIEVAEHKFYISRAAKKLEEYLKEFSLPIGGAKCLDVGSSTGGFSQILLEFEAKSVACVDVGKEQLHSIIKNDARVEVYEECDIRDFTSDAFDVIVSDVSFISLNLILESVDRLSKNNTTIALLFKPQFEVGKSAKRDSKGVVVDKEAISKAKEIFLDNTKKLNWKLIDRRDSKISGKEGNIEEFFTFKK